MAVPSSSMLIRSRKLALIIPLVVAAMLSGPAHGQSMPGTTAIFLEASAQPGATVPLRVDANADLIALQMISALPSRAHAAVQDDRPVGPAQLVWWRPGTATIAVRIGEVPSGVYFMRVSTNDGVALAPLVVRPAQLGRNAIAVVVPTYSWQAYNWRDGDTWYACDCVRTVALDRPYMGLGLPYNFERYDRHFLEWLANRRVPVDYLSDQDLEAIASGAQLRRLYRMIVFEGHGEYVTSHIYDLVASYRDLGGHLAFLSANDFFRDVVVGGESMTLIGRWRDLGRPEASLIGSQYIDWYRNIYRSRPYVVTGANRVPWLFAGTGLRNGAMIDGHYGIEIDGLAPSSPPNTIVVADIPDIFPGETAQMTYYTTPAGAEVFNAGTINFGGSAEIPVVSTMLANLFSHLTAAVPPRSASGRPAGAPRGARAALSAVTGGHRCAMPRAAPACNAATERGA
jgi:hypothetical protein